MKVLYANFFTYVVPKLRLGNSNELAYVGGLTPYIGKAAEGKSLKTEEVLAAPNYSELYGKLALDALVEGLIEDLKVKCVLEICGVKEVIQTEKEVLVAKAYATIVLYLKAERSKCRIVPEVEATCNLHVAAAYGVVLFAIDASTIEVVIDEEEGVTPAVIVETLKRSSNVLAVKIIECLEVGLGLNGKSKGQSCKSYCCKFFEVHIE